MTSHSNFPPERKPAPERVWVGCDAIGGLMVYPKRPEHGQAAEYMRVLSRQEVEKLAGDGVDVQQYLNSLLRTIEGQRRSIANLRDQLTAMTLERDALWNAANTACEDMGCFCHEDHDTTLPEKRSPLCRLGDLLATTKVKV